MVVFSQLPPSFAAFSLKRGCFFRSGKLALHEKSTLGTNWRRPWQRRSFVFIRPKLESKNFLVPLCFLRVCNCSIPKDEPGIGEIRETRIKTKLSSKTFIYLNGFLLASGCRLIKVIHVLKKRTRQLCKKKKWERENSSTCDIYE